MPTAITIYPNFATLPFFDDTASFTARITDQFDEVMDGTVAWSSEHPDVFAVQETGVVTAVGPGTGYLQASFKGLSGTASITSIPVLSTFARELSSDVEADGLGGMTTALAQDGVVLWHGTYGWADRENGVLAARQTIYRVGSISKSVTSVLMAILADGGAAELDTSLEELVPEAHTVQDRPHGARPTLRQLASHTAGWEREPELAGAWVGPVSEWKAKVLESIPTARYRNGPGREYHYSNIGYGVLGLALDRAGGRGFIDNVHDRIFDPLDMNSSTYLVEGDMVRRRAKGYYNRSDGTVNTELPASEHRGRGYRVPNGGVYSTVDDLVRFAAGVMGRGGGELLLSEGMRMELLRVQTPGNRESGYGLGFSIRSTGGRVLAGHGGWVPGYTAQLSFEPATGRTVVLLRNYNVGRTNLSAAARELLMGLPPD